ncbi:MAG: alpha/beta hydrolase [Candidatus Saccharibacteria bacterium]|nr:alpha/beta hydrolase [Moraxellaceae bacterium]
MTGLVNNLTAPFEKLQGVAARLTMRIPPLGQRMLAKALGFDNQFPNLDPHLQLLIAARNRIGGGSLIGSSPEQSRRQFRKEMLSIVSKPTPVASVDEWFIPTDSFNIPVRHYIPKLTGHTKNDLEKRPLLIFFHGGGFVVGDLDTHDEPCRLFCQVAQVHVLSIAYRLAPEHPAPTAVEDCLAALIWAHAHAADLNIDPNKIAVGGDSAGGNLAAVVSQLAVGQSYAPAVQLLLYPGIDFANKYPSHTHYGQGLFLDQSDIDNAKLSYTANNHDLHLDPRISPLYGNLAGLASTLLVTAEFDVLRDEGELYAVKLREAGTACIGHRVLGQGHGFINMTTINHGAMNATLKIAQELKAMLA